MIEQQELAERLKEHRRGIDAIDERIVVLLNERAGHSLAIRDIKAGMHAGLFDPVREDEILQAVAQRNEGPLYDENLKEIYRCILKVMKEIPANE